MCRDPVCRGPLKQRLWFDICSVEKLEDEPERCVMRNQGGGTVNTEIFFFLLTRDVVQSDATFTLSGKSNQENRISDLSPASAAHVSPVYNLLRPA